VYIIYGCVNEYVCMNVRVFVRVFVRVIPLPPAFGCFEILEACSKHSFVSLEDCFPVGSYAARLPLTRTSTCRWRESCHRSESMPAIEQTLSVFASCAMCDEPALNNLKCRGWDCLWAATNTNLLSKPLVQYCCRVAIVVMAALLSLAITWLLLLCLHWHLRLQSLALAAPPLPHH